MSEEKSNPQGWVALHRALTESQLWMAEPFTRGQAWVDLILLANHKNGFIRVAGEKIEIKRGQCGWSKLRLSERWKWSEGKLRRFFSELKTAGQIEEKATTRTTIISICNYSKYQDIAKRNGGTESGSDKATDSEQTATNNNGNHENNKNNKQQKAIRSLQDLETVDLNGHYQSWFETKAPDVDRFVLRDEMLFYCRSKGRKYADYWATMQTWATKRQREIEAKKQGGKDWSPF